MAKAQSQEIKKETGQGPMWTAGRVIKAIGGIAFAYVFILWYVYPAINSPNEFFDWIVTSEGIQNVLTDFIPIIIVIWIGSYIQHSSAEKRTKRQDQMIGFLKTYGRISLQELATRMGMNVDEVEKELTTIRTERDTVFTISNGYVNMPGSETGEPDKKVEFKEVERITKEIAMTQCKYCKSAIPINSVKCPNCGANLSCN